MIGRSNLAQKGTVKFLSTTPHAECSPSVETTFSHRSTSRTQKAIERGLVHEELARSHAPNNNSHEDCALVAATRRWIKSTAVDLAPSDARELHGNGGSRSWTRGQHTPYGPDEYARGIAKKCKVLKQFGS